MQKTTYRKQLGWQLFLLTLLPNLVWAASNKQVMEISSAIVSVPSGIIMIAIIVRNYMRYQDDAKPCRDMHKYAKKTKYFTILLTSIPVINLFSQAFHSPSLTLFWKATLLSIPSLLLGGISYKLSQALEEKHDTSCSK